MNAKWIVCLAIVAVTSGVAYGVTPSFQGLGPVQGVDFSQALGVSADGSVVVGYGYSGVHPQPFRWTAAGGMKDLGNMPGKSSDGVAYGASSDGAVVVGWGNERISPEAFRWTQADGMVGLGFLPGGLSKSTALDVSADGATVVGHARPSLASSAEAFRWTAEGGMVGLGYLPGSGISPASKANAISADGSVIVGESDSTASDHQAFRWTADGGMVGLGDLPGGYFESTASDVSRDGSVVVGTGSSDNCVHEAFRWTAAGGMQGLGCGGSGSSAAYGVSGDGTVVVGWASGVGAFIWDADHGMRDLKDVLENDCGLDLTGWDSLTAKAISDDGLTIVGYGDNPNGDEEAWVAVIPEPATLSLLAVGAMALIRRRRK